MVAYNPYHNADYSSIAATSDTVTIRYNPDSCHTTIISSTRDGVETRYISDEERRFLDNPDIGENRMYDENINVVDLRDELMKFAKELTDSTCKEEALLFVKAMVEESKHYVLVCRHSNEAYDRFHKIKTMIGHTPLRYLVSSSYGNKFIFRNSSSVRLIHSRETRRLRGLRITDWAATENRRLSVNVRTALTTLSATE